MVTIKKNGRKAWVTFTYMPVDGTKDVSISGEWNEWKEEPMKQKKSGAYSITKILTSGSNFQFGYKVNGHDWVTEDECPSVPSVFSSQNSVLEL